jgi:hypothetical protein
MNHDENQDQLCGIPRTDYLNEGLEQIYELRETIMEKLSEMEFIIKDIARESGHEMILTRARAYWLPTVRGCLEEGGTATMIPLDDTVKEIIELFAEEDIVEEPV